MVVMMCSVSALGQTLDLKETPAYRRLKQFLDSVPAIDTHDHLRPFDSLAGRVKTDRGSGMTLASLWQNSYYTWYNPLTPWPNSGRFDDWWPRARDDFANARATMFYRYQLPAFQHLYGVDFDTITDEQARELNDRIFANYQNPRWLDYVITERANVELILIDPYWDRLGATNTYPFAVHALNVTTLLHGTHPTAYQSPSDSPYYAAAEEKLPTATLDDYLAVLDWLVQRAKANGAVCLKNTVAYERTLQFNQVPKETAARHYGHPPNELTAIQLKEFQDFIMWRLMELAAKYDLPVQIHTGHARIQGSNPMFLVELIASHPKTKFILFHGGYPWVGETGAIATRHRNVWIDSVWLPIISYTMARRAFQEWLEVMPSDRLLWGSDTGHAEGVYAAAETTRRCLAETLAEKVVRGELREEHAQRIGQQILRDNALALFPSLQHKLWKHKTRQD
jgi:predicted TIM-barrel fold metal-dependent hydrolase